MHMKNFYKNLSITGKTVFIEAAIGVGAMFVSIVAIVLDYPGWTIGIALGTIASVVSAIFMNLSAKWALKDQKAGLFFLGFLVRMLLIVILFTFTVLMQFVAKVKVFDYSFAGLFIGFAPSIFVNTILQMKYGNK